MPHHVKCAPISKNCTYAWLMMALMMPIQAIAADESSPLSEIYACGQIQDDKARLACYDSKVPVIQEKEARQEIVTVDAVKANEIKREAFGFKMPKISKIFKQATETDPKDDILTASVASISGGRKPVITLNNGQIWRVIDGKITRRFKGDIEITIKPASLGSYMAALTDGIRRNGGLRVRRIE